MKSVNIQADSKYGTFCLPNKENKIKINYFALNGFEKMALKSFTTHTF